MTKKNIEDCLWNIAAIREQEENLGYPVDGYKKKGCYDCVTPCNCYVSVKEYEKREVTKCSQG